MTCDSVPETSLSLELRQSVLFLRAGANMQLDRSQVCNGSRRGLCINY